MFDTASSREDYYKLLAQKIYHIRKELEDRKKLKGKGERRCKSPIVRSPCNELLISSLQVFPK